LKEQAANIFDGNTQPISGRVIGHIFKGEFVPVTKKLKESNLEMLSYGTSALVQSVTSDIFSDLLRVFPINKAVTIMAIATLQVTKPSIAS
jgi:hypothetical protein